MKKESAGYKTLTIVKNDDWLKPVAREVYERFERFQNRLKQINDDYGSLNAFADAYNYYGLNYDAKLKGWWYREWAPKARDLFIFGDFNNWQRYANRLIKNEFGIWETFLPDSEYEGRFVHESKIKILVHGDNGFRERIPAYIRKVIQDPKTTDYAGQVWNPKTFNWGNDNKFKPAPAPLLIYEAHIGMAQEEGKVGSFNEFTQNVLPRIKSLGYNAVQLMAIAEHPYYGSFGYHVSNFFAPSSRNGNPEDLKLLVKTAHELGLMVIMDIVHSHTIKNLNEGLNQLDGSDDHYCHPGERGNHPVWDSLLFDYGKTEVLRFLLSNLKYWIREFHFDGFRFDGVASMIYLHHGYDIPINTQAKYFQTGVEFDAITYLQLANKLVHQIKPYAITIAEEVSGMPGLTNKISDGGIGFDFRLAMGVPDFWIKTVKEIKDEDWDIYEIYHTLLDRKFDVPTVGYCESHDQALVGDQTLSFRLMGEAIYQHMTRKYNDLRIDRGIALHKEIRLITLVLSGHAYMNFMGNEFGHPEWIDFPREGNNWSYHFARRQWSLAENPELKYAFLQNFDKAMIKLVTEYPILSSDFPRDLNFDHENKTLVFERSGLIFLFNFHPFNSISDYSFPIPESGKFKVILNSDHWDFGGFQRCDDSLDYFSYWDDATGTNRLRIYNPNRTALVLKRVD
jgi:1,4-alpha-glucan branching enzyme